MIAVVMPTKTRQLALHSEHSLIEDLLMEIRGESKYERLRKIGIGSYGVVFKCVNRESGQVVAIKRYSENDSDPNIRKIAMREVRMLRQLKHQNLINLIEVFRRKRRLHLVFDYCELTVLDVVEKYGNSCPINLIKKIVWQIVNGLSYCHSHNCVHRDIKPENILINQSGLVKLCDFGFARYLSSSGQLMRQSTPLQVQLESNRAQIEPERQALTEYVATRWYRAPELLIGELYYDIKIDIWALGCVAGELMRGEPIWPGKTDLDQLLLIQSSLGQLTANQTHTLIAQSLYDQVSTEIVLAKTSSPCDYLERKLPAISRIGQSGLSFILACLQMDPERRATSDQLLKHNFIHSSRMGLFLKELDSGQNLSTAKQNGSQFRSFLSLHSDRSNSQTLKMASLQISDHQRALPKRIEQPSERNKTQPNARAHPVNSKSKLNTPAFRTGRQLTTISNSGHVTIEKERMHRQSNQTVNNNDSRLTKINRTTGRTIK